MQANNTFNNIKPHLIILACFIIISCLFCLPAFQGNVLMPHDTYNWLSMSYESREFYEKTGTYTGWANNMFGGMPQALIDIRSDNNLYAKLNTAVQMHQYGTPHNPAVFFWLAMVSFYLLMNVLRINKWMAGIGAVAFAFSTYNPIIIVAGHATKMLDIAFIPGVLAGVVLAYRRKYLLGAAVAGLFLAFFIDAGHYQIIFYTIFLVGFLILTQLVIAIRKKELKSFFIASICLAAAASFAAATTATKMITTQELLGNTQRGGKSELTITGTEKSGGLDKDYAFRWSNGIEETLGLIVPDLYGGKSQTGLYWGAQQADSISGSVYFGITICFFFVLGIIIIRSPHKWWLIGGTVFFIMISWGKNFPLLNFTLFNHFPMFNKWRSPNMAIAIASVTVPIMAMWAVRDFMKTDADKDFMFKSLKKAIYIMGGISVLILIATQAFLDYKGPVDAQIFGNNANYLSKIIEERQSIATSDAMRSLVILLIAAGILWAFIKSKISKNIAIGALALIVMIDILPIARRYLNPDINEYMEETAFDNLMSPRPVDREILQDKSYFRVLDLTINTFNDASSSKFLKTLGGYNAAKLETYQDLITVQISQYNSAVLNMLNTKYIIQQPMQANGQPAGAPRPSINPDALGNAWFVNEIKWAKNADEEMMALNAPSLARPAADGTEAFNPKQTVVIRENHRGEITQKHIGSDAGSSIELTHYQPNKLVYKSSNSTAGFGVFSEIYYPDGWTAKIDGQVVPIHRVNYVLRGLEIPAGAHEIEFSFELPGYAKGEKIALIGSVLLSLLILAAIVEVFRKRKKNEVSIVKD